MTEATLTAVKRSVTVDLRRHYRRAARGGVFDAATGSSSVLARRNGCGKSGNPEEVIVAECLLAECEH